MVPILAPVYTSTTLMCTERSMSIDSKKSARALIAASSSAFGFHPWQWSMSSAMMTGTAGRAETRAWISVALISVIPILYPSCSTSARPRSPGAPRLLDRVAGRLPSLHLVHRDLHGLALRTDHRDRLLQLEHLLAPLAWCTPSVVQVQAER